MRIACQGPIHLPRSVTAKIAERFEGNEFDADSGWLEYFREATREAWQEHGYFYASVSVQTQVSGGDPIHQRVSLTVHVDERQRFRVGKIRFIDAHEFPPAELRKAFALREGDVFDIGKLRLRLDGECRHGWRNKWVRRLAPRQNDLYRKVMRRFPRSASGNRLAPRQNDLYRK